MADNIEHQDKGELVANCDRFNSLKHSTLAVHTIPRSTEESSMWLTYNIFKQILICLNRCQ